MPRAASRNTGSSTRKPKPSPFFGCGDAYEEAGNYRRGESAESVLLAASRSPLPRCSTPIEAASYSDSIRLFATQGQSEQSDG